MSTGCSPYVNLLYTNLCCHWLGAVDHVPWSFIDLFCWDLFSSHLPSAAGRSGGVGVGRGPKLRGGGRGSVFCWARRNISTGTLLGYRVIKPVLPLPHPQGRQIEYKKLLISVRPETKGKHLAEEDIDAGRESVWGQSLREPRTQRLKSQRN